MNLRELGLSEYEERAYKALIKLGKTTASKVSREGNVSYGKIYEILGSLETKGLVRVIPDQTKMFVASDPKNLMLLVDKKEKELNNIKKEVNDLKQIYSEQEEEAVKIARGKRNFYMVMKETPSATKYAYAIKYTSEYHPDFVESSKRHVREELEKKTLTRFDDETKSNVQKWLKIYPHIRKIENEGVAMDINDKSVVIGLIKSNTTMAITDKAFIKIMKLLFEKTYANAEQIKSETR